MRSSINIAHTAWIAAGAPGTAVDLTVDNYLIAMNSKGWRSNGGSGTNAGTLTPTASNCLRNLDYMINGPETVISSASCTKTPCYVATASGSVCTYTLDGTSYTIRYDVSNGSVISN